MARLAIKGVEREADFVTREPLCPWSVNWALAFARLKVKQLLFRFRAMLLLCQAVCAVLFRGDPHWINCSIELPSTELVDKVECVLPCLVAVKPIDYCQGP